MLENDKICIVFNRVNGGITHLINKNTKTDFIIDKLKQSIFRVILPLPDYDGHHLDSVDQRATCYTKEDSITFEYNGLHSNKGIFDIFLNYTAIFCNDGVELAFEIINKTALEITEIWFPWLSGLREVRHSAQKTMLLIPGGNIDTFPSRIAEKIKNPVESFRFSSWAEGGGMRAGRRIWWYPWMMQWVDLYNNEEGLYFGYHNQEKRTKAFLIQKEFYSSKTFSMAWVRYPHLSREEEFVSKGHLLVPHRGDWHQASNIYRKWLLTWLRPCDVPNDVRESLGWHFSFIKHGDGTCVRSYEEIPLLYRAAKKAGLHILQLYGWHQAGMDRDFPNYVPIQEMGGLSKLRAALKKVAREGGRVALYQAGSALHLLCGSYSEQIREWANKSGFGEMYYWNWTWNLYDTNHWRREQPLISMCYTKDLVDMMVEKAVQFVKDYGATTVHLDHIGYRPFELCYDKHHGHSKPDEAFSHIKDVYRRIREEIRKVDPTATVHCEGVNEISGQWVDIHWSTGRLNLDDDTISVLRYTLPEYLLTTQIHENSYQDASRAFVYGLLFDVSIELGTGWIADYPEFGEYLAKLAQLKKELKDFLVYGNFRDEIGVKTSSEVLAKVYCSKKGVAIPLVNITEKTIETEIEVDYQQIGISPPTDLLMYSLGEREPKRCRSTNRIHLKLVPTKPKVVILPVATNL